MYRDIGKTIVERREKHGWGQSVVEKPARDLQKEFDSMRGFSPQNLWFMRQFYMEYKNHSNLQRIVRELAWGHNIRV